MSGWSDDQQQGSSYAGVGSASLGTSLESLMLADQLVPGSDVSYQLAKTIFLYHPLGAKLAETPISMAMSQAREITVADAPDAVGERFKAQWTADLIDSYVHTLHTLARVYGIASVVYGAPDIPTNEAIDPDQIARLPLYFNVLDPLNSSGSLVLNQDPNAPDFQKPASVSAAGQTYHRSRACVVMHEQPIYIAYSTSAFGFVGRSVYQRALFPLKSFVQTMLTDDMISQKAGVLVAKIRQPGSITDRLTNLFQGVKRSLLKRARNYNIISIDLDESIESLNLNNIDGAASVARENILKNIGIAADVPPAILANQVFVQGFGEGIEDAKNVAHWIDSIRMKMAPTYAFFDPLIMRRAWTEDFFETMRAQYPEKYDNTDYQTAFYGWKNEFTATWPSMLTEPDSEKIKVDKEKFNAVKDLLETLVPILDGANRANLVQWVADRVNETPMLFTGPLRLDVESLQDFCLDADERARQAPAMPGADDAQGAEAQEAEPEPEPVGEAPEAEPGAREAREPNPELRAVA